MTYTSSVALFASAALLVACSPGETRNASQDMGIDGEMPMMESDMMASDGMRDDMMGDGMMAGGMMGVIRAA